MPGNKHRSYAPPPSPGCGLPAQIIQAAEQSGRTVEEVAQTALAHLTEQAPEAVSEQDGLTTATPEGAKNIAFRPAWSGHEKTPGHGE
ncbi:hypothetical protein [Streptomyces venezuelae]|uniref:hypothetical protein n=1 Tax=Streptomyces venezuelae TaxID=54571 RepID=UPI00123C3046|nr:hypothetical protein [Streptomyces venezuelae]